VESGEANATDEDMVLVFCHAHVSDVHLIAAVNWMETESVGWLAYREEAIRAHAKALPGRRQPTNAVVIVWAVMTVACIAVLVLELVERTG
jgi:hypothetical protein